VCVCVCVCVCDCVCAERGNGAGEKTADVVVVQKLTEGGSAAVDGGILPGDLITHIDAVPVGQPPRMDDVIRRIMGPPETAVHLKLIRPLHCNPTNPAPPATSNACLAAAAASIASTSSSATPGDLTG
jgi:hypothetical protein